ncbi:hypothetical protein [Bartonella queenslandensis]|uniref:hypothetical protein n=1 Tax=Bartonella queenslandensis TaxID=481138 RepID=UPI001BA8D371|nr:hypothetical protein [Bartonella queenslandensis]
MAKPLVEVQAVGVEKFIMNKLKMKEIYAIEESSFKSSNNKVFYSINMLRKVFKCSKLNN